MTELQKLMSEFNTLPITQRFELVHKHGRPVIRTQAIWLRQPYQINLYIVGNQYVEIWYNMKKADIDIVRVPMHEELEVHLMEIRLPGFRKKDDFYFDSKY